MKLYELKERHFNVSIEEMFVGDLDIQTNKEPFEKLKHLLRRIAPMFSDEDDFTFWTENFFNEHSPSLSINNTIFIESREDGYLFSEESLFQVFELQDNTNGYWRVENNETNYSFTEDELVQLFDLKVPVGIQTLNSF